jgi:hypothetical protein
VYRLGSDDVVSDASGASTEGLEEETRTNWEDAGRPCSDAIELDVFGR